MQIGVMAWMSVSKMNILSLCRSAIGRPQPMIQCRAAGRYALYRTVFVTNSDVRQSDGPSDPMRIPASSAKSTMHGDDKRGGSHGRYHRCSCRHQEHTRPHRKGG